MSIKDSGEVANTLTEDVIEKEEVQAAPPTKTGHEEDEFEEGLC